VSGWSPARIYCAGSGVFLLMLAAGGFTIGGSFPTSSGAVVEDGHIFGIFETNGWHNLAGLLSGAAALGFGLRPEWSRLGALVKGYFYVVVTVSVALWGGETFLIASNTADQIIHGSMAVLGLLAGYLTAPETSAGRPLAGP
jgi:hypothetical protein